LDAAMKSSAKHKQRKPGNSKEKVSKVDQEGSVCVAFKGE
jgi:hypothetical protein